MKIKCLIVEDEPFAQKGLEEFIGNVSFLQLVAIADDALEALDVLQLQAVDLMFLDVQMPRLSGLELLNTLPDPPLVIFTTAYAEYALQGYEYDIVDYLVKPVPFERFLKSVNKAKVLYELRNPANKYDFFFIKTNKKLEKIYTAELTCVEALAHYVILHTTTRKYITYLSLKNIEQKLPLHFIKIHRSYLVPFDKIESVDAENVVINGKQIPVSKNYRDNLMELLKDRIVKR